MTIDIVETVIPVPQAKPRDSVRYSSTYEGADGAVFEVELEQTEYSSSLSVTRKGTPYCGFASAGDAPPMMLFTPTFAAWLDAFIVEAKRRYAASSEEVADVQGR